MAYKKLINNNMSICTQNNSITYLLIQFAWLLNVKITNIGDYFSKVRKRSRLLIISAAFCNRSYYENKRKKDANNPHHF